MIKRASYQLLGIAFCLLACQSSPTETAPPSINSPKLSGEIQSFRYDLTDLVEGQTPQTIEVALDYTFREPVAYEAYA
ncbi:MAG: hypothetical protein AAF399_04195, partial [Bacteroidota bacterium]